MTSIDVLEPQHPDSQRADEFTMQQPTSLMYYSSRYRWFLHDLLPGAESFYVVAKQQQQIVALLPVFIKRGPHGTVANSLPFFGSHGGILASQECTESTICQLQKAFYQLCKEKSVDVATLVCNPLVKGGKQQLEWEPSFRDSRIGQLTFFPDCKTEDTEQSLMAMFHSKTRNMVRKANKFGFDYGIDNSEDMLNLLHYLHSQNMARISGKAKPLHVFKSLKKHFEPNGNFHIYVARHREKVAAMLLLLTFRDSVEYYTPVIHEKFRNEQPLSGLIFHAMQDSMNKGFRFWNWGGTWHSQDGVYRFKSRWGTTDIPYRYETKLFNQSTDILKQAPEALEKEYPYFYVVPYGELQIPVATEK